MINQLFRTSFESSISYFIVFIALNMLFGQIAFNVYDNPVDPLDQVGEFANIAFFLLFILIIHYGLVLVRYKREKYTRLYKQLPLTALQIRLAYWCQGAFYILISTLTLILIVRYCSLAPLTDILPFALLFLFHTGALLAIVSIVGGNSIRLLPAEIRKRSILYFFMAAVLTFLSLVFMGFIIGGYTYLAEGGSVDWALLTTLMALACAALVMLDIHLYQRQEEFLG